MNIRTLLTLDAVTCILTAVVLLAFTLPVASLTGLAPVLLVAGGAALIPIGLLMLVLSRYTRPPDSGVVAVIALNLIWVVGCLAAIVFAGPNLLGSAFLGLQAIAVAAFAWAEWRFGIGRAASAL